MASGTGRKVARETMPLWLLVYLAAAKTNVKMLQALLSVASDRKVHARHISVAAQAKPPQGRRGEGGRSPTL